MSDVTFELRTKKPAAAAGEAMFIEIEIFNHSPRTVVVPNPMEYASPQPVYRLRRPDGTAVSFSPQIRLQHPTKGSPPLLHLPQGGGWAGDFSVDLWTDVRAPGEYTLEGQIDWEDVHLVAKPIRFTIRAFRQHSLTLLEHGRQEGGPHRAALLTDENGVSATTWFLEESRFDSGEELEVSDTLPIGPLSERPLALLPTYKREEDKAPGIIAIGLMPSGLLLKARDGAEVRTRSTSPIRAGLRALLAPAAGGRTGLHAFVVLAGEPSDLGYVNGNLDYDSDRLEVSPIRPIAHLGPAFLAADTAIGTIEQGSPMIVASVAAREGGAQLSLLQVSDGGGVSRRAELHIPGFEPVAPLAAQVDRSGRIDAAFVAKAVALEEGATQPTLHLIEVESPLQAFEPRWRSTRMGRPTLEVKQLLVAYSGLGSYPPNPAVFLRTGTDRHVFFRANRGSREITEPIGPNHEVALLGVHAWYLLVNDGSSLRRVPLY